MGLSQFAVQNTDRDVNSGLKLVCFTAQRNELPVLWQHPVSHPAHPTRGQIVVTSACFSPLSQTILGLGYIDSQDISTEEPLVDPLGEFEQIALCRRPLFDPSKRVVRGHWSGNFGQSIDAEQGRIQSHDGICHARIQTNASLALSIDKPILLTRFCSLSTMNFAT